ncbi:MAG: hypothetical protein Kilf2KO_02330 [Rhodospirillales bacterium]
MAEVITLSHYVKDAQRARGGSKRGGRPVYFERAELQALMALYSEQVMAGAWRDYALDHLVGMAAFSIYRRAQERPVYTLAKRQIGPGSYEYVLFEEGRRRRKAGDLGRLIAWLRTPLTVVG